LLQCGVHQVNSEREAIRLLKGGEKHAV